MPKYKTWRFRLMTGLQRKELGSHLLLSAHYYLSHPPNPAAPLGHDIVGFNETEALRLLWNIWHKEGNFHRKGGHLSKWDEFESRVRFLPWRVRHRIKLIWGAVTCDNNVVFLDEQC